MDYSTELLEKIRDLAEKLTTISEISVLLDIDERELRDEISTYGSDARRAFLGGYAKTALEIRKRNLELSQAGSPAADEAVRSYLRKMLDEI